MRIGELSGRSGVPVPTIKYYLREGLLPAGERTSPNQAQYTESHLRRLNLVRALVEIGGLSIAAARGVLSTMDTTGAGPLETLGKAQYAVTGRRDGPDDAASRAADAQVDALLQLHNWTVKPDNPARKVLGEVLATLHRLGQDDLGQLLEDCADAAEQLAVTEIDVIALRPDLDSMATAAVVWTVLGDTVLGALRRMAQESEATSRFGRS